MNYVIRLLGNEREALLSVRGGLTDRLLSTKPVDDAIDEIDAAAAMLRAKASPPARAEEETRRRRGRKPRSAAARGESDEVFAQGASDTIPPAVGEDDEEVNLKKERVA